METTWLLFATFLLIMHSVLLSAYYEHKIYNIVSQYPDNHSWCKTIPIKQNMTWRQCSSQEFDNNICVGACFSYTVPHDELSTPDDIRPYCDSCQPLNSVWHTVTLDCKDEHDNPMTMQKEVQIITNCSCNSCTETSKIKSDCNISPTKLYSPPRFSSKILFYKLKETLSQKIGKSRVEELFPDFKEEIDLEKLKETIKKYNQENQKD